VSKESPFIPKADLNKQIMLDSVDFSFFRNPTKNDPKDYKGP
jgi:hypothetical protein